MPKRKSSQRKLPPAPQGDVAGPWETGTASAAAAPAATPASADPTPSRRMTHGSLPTTVDMGKARHEALFQLRLGRQSLAFGFIVGLLLIVDSAIALFIGSAWLSSAGQLPVLKLVINNQLPLVLPLIASLFLSVMVFIEKYDTYGFWPWEDHFALTIAGMVLSVALAVIYGLNFSGRLPGFLLAAAPYMYPLVLTALSLGMVSLGTTWRGWPLRKLSSVVFAILPPVLSIPLSFSFSPLANAGIPGLSGGALNLSLSITFSFAAFLYTASGAQLHLMASATRAQEREVVAGSHEKLFALSQELSQRGEAALFREEALSRRETDVEAQEGTLVERARFLEDRRQELETLDKHLRSKGEEMLSREHALLPKAAEVSAAEASLKERNAQLTSQEHELHAGFQRLGDRERNLLEREQTTRQKELELQNRLSEVARQESQSKVVEQTAQSRLQEAERRFAAAAAKEADVRAKESSMVLPPDARSRVQAKDAEISRREAAVEAQRAEVTDRLSAATQKEQAVEARRLDLQQKAAMILEREKSVANREATLSSKERQYEVELDLLKGATKRHEDEIRKYFDATKKSTLVESQSSLMMSQLREKETGVSLREQKVGEREREVQARSEEAQRLTQEAAAQKRVVEAQAADLRLRSTRLEEATARLAPSRTEADANLSQALKDRERALELRERQLTDREQKVKAQQYERERQAQAGPVPGAEEPTGLLGVGPTPSLRRPGKVSTGTPRLDDLLLGGFPEHGHVAFVGPSFVGKEVAIYNFLAEGLRKGEGALIVSTSRSPSETAKELGIIVPSLMEYEGAGRVVWIDASNPAGVASGDARSRVGSTVKGPGDIVGILQAVSKHAAELEKKGTGFRVAFLSLSACITQTDEKGAAAFVQNVLGILRPKGSPGAYSVERGMHSEQQVQGIVSQMDGAVEIQTERGKTQLRVLGLGDVQSRQWVDYRFTQRALQLGSFSLERIR